MSLEWDELLELLEQQDRTLEWLARPQPLPGCALDLDSYMADLKRLAEADPLDDLRALAGLPPKRPTPEW